MDKERTEERPWKSGLKTRAKRKCNKARKGDQGRAQERRKGVLKIFGAKRFAREMVAKSGMKKGFCT